MKCTSATGFWRRLALPIDRDAARRTKQAVKGAACLLMALLLWMPGPVLADGADSGAEKHEGNADANVGKRSPAAAEAMELSLPDFIRRVREANERILVQQSQVVISQQAIENARSIFEPAAIGSFKYGDESYRNTVEQTVSQDGADIFKEWGTDSQAAVEGLLPTGARIRFGSTLRAFRNSLQENADVDREYRSFLGMTLTQPLLKGAGIKATTTGIQVAEKDADITFQAYRQETMRVLSEAAAVYWNLYFAQEQYAIRRASEQHARNLLRVNLARVKTGKMAETEALEARSALAFRQSLVSEAKQNITGAMNAVRSLFSNSAAHSRVPIRATDRIEIPETEVDFEDSLNRAFQLRPEYLSARTRIEREEIRLVFAKNQRWPQLDLAGSYGHNGLAETFGDTYSDITDNQFRNWSIGVEMRIPLFGDRKSRSELAASMERKRQALLELKAVEVAVANAVDTAIKNIRTAKEQIGHYARVVEMTRLLLEAESARFERGKSNSRILLDKEEDLNLAREAEMKSLVKHQQALLQLALAEGSVLVNNGAEVMEVK